MRCASRARLAKRVANAYSERHRFLGASLHEMKGAGRSALGRTWAAAWSGAATGWHATPAAARRRFFALLAGAVLLAALLSALGALAVAAATGGGALPGDAAVVGWLEDRLTVHAALWLGTFTTSAMVVPLLLLAGVLAARAGLWERAVLTVATFAASKVIILAGWLTWPRPRPGGVAGGEIIPEGLGSFPSGHAVQVWTVYGLFALWWVCATDRWWERGLAWAALVAGTVVVGAARVRIGAHWPSDIVAGALLGGLWVLGMAWAERGVRSSRRVSPGGGAAGG